MIVIYKNKYLTFTILLIGLTTSTFSTIHSVPQKFKNIQSAVNASKSNDTVLVDEGLYYENIIINKNIVVASRFILDHDTAHIQRTIIDGSRPKNKFKASVILINGKTDSSCVLQGFTIRRGSGTYVHYSIEPGLSVNDPGVNEHWIAGGGIFVNHTGARIAHNIITENKVETRIHKNYSFGAAIAAQESTFGKHLPSPIIIEYNTICNNLSTGDFSEGAGIDLVQPAIIRYNTITDNRTVSKTRSIGGAVVIGMSGNYDIVVDGNYICRNVAGIGAGMLITSGFNRRGRAIVTNNIIADNEAFEVGGAANIAEGTYVVFVNNTIVRNKAMASGGGLNVTFGSHATLINNIIWGNKAEQVSMWGDVQAVTNVVQGGYPGRNNLDNDPMFLPDDSLLRLSPNSPCLGTGTDSIHIFQNLLPIPDHDLLGHRRPVPEGTSRDIGAIESPFDLPSISTGIIRERAASLDSKLKLTMVIDQITLADRDSITSEIVRAGRMNSTLFVNDSIRFPIHDSLPVHSFTLPPEDNLIELEVIGRAISKSRGINIFFWLEGSDPHVSLLPKNHGVEYNYYSELKPGTYKLIFQPQDQERIIGHTNRASIEIIVLPYWYQRWWSYVIYAVGVIGIAFGFYRQQIASHRLTQKLTNEHLLAEKASEMSVMKSRFLANISHELRTPLTMIIGPIDALIARSNNKEFTEQLGYVQRNSRKLLRLIEQLLQFSRLESGNVKLSVSPIDIVPFLRRVTGYFTSQAAKNQIELEFHSSAESIHGIIDAEKIEHVLQNCISNSLKYTHAGGMITVRVWQEKQELNFSVNDTGEGIAPEHLPYVFDRFYRVDSSHKIEGTGIGLSLSKELVDVHRGSIFLDSDLGKGTTVTVRIPLSGYSESELAAVPYVHREFEIISSTSSSLSDTNIPVSDELPIVLIAEDNSDTRGFLRSQLTRQYTVIEAMDGDDALNKTKFQIPDLVVSDVMMPKKNGWDLCDALKSDERTCHIPVILLTALAEKEDRLKGLTTGADDYLVKPFDAHELLTRIQNLLENRRRLRESYGKTVPLSLGEISVTSLDNQFLTKTIAIINDHLSDPGLSVEQFAHEMFLSRTQLHRKLKAVTNLSPGDYIRHLRLQRAKELLEKNAGSIAEIADSVGFTNHSYFAKCFQEHFGHLPSQVRNS